MLRLQFWPVSVASLMTHGQLFEETLIDFADVHEYKIVEGPIWVSDGCCNVRGSEVETEAR